MFHFVYLIRAYANRRADRAVRLFQFSPSRKRHKIGEKNKSASGENLEREARPPPSFREAQIYFVADLFCFVFFFRLREGLSWERGTARSRLC